MPFLFRIFFSGTPKYTNASCKVVTQSSKMIIHSPRCEGALELGVF